MYLRCHCIPQFVTRTAWAAGGFNCWNLSPASPLERLTPTDASNPFWKLVVLEILSAHSWPGITECTVRGPGCQGQPYEFLMVFNLRTLRNLSYFIFKNGHNNTFWNGPVCRCIDMCVWKHQAHSRYSINTNMLFASSAKQVPNNYC